MILDQAFNSTKVRKLAIMLVLAGLIICIIPLLPPVQNVLFSFVVTRISDRGAGGAFERALRSLLSLPFFGFVVFTLALCCLFSKTISMFLEDIKNTRLIVVLTAGIGVLLLCFVSIFSYQYGWQWLSSDNSSEMVLGKLLADENTFISRNFHYSTEIRLIYQTIFTMPLFKLLGSLENWALIRSLNILLNNITLVLSYVFMTRQMKIKTKWICITSLFLILPISTGYWYIVTFGGYYIFFIAQLFCCLGLFIRLVDSGTAKTALIDFILFTALSFMLGVQGIRSMLSVHIPLLISCVYWYSKTAQKKNFPLFLGCYSFVVCCAGIAVNYLLHFWYSFHSFENMRLVNLYDEFFPKLGQSLASLLGFFGLSIGSSLLSAQGLFSVAAITGSFLLFWMVTKSIRKKKIQNNTTEQAVEYLFIPIFFIVSVIFNIFVFIIVDEVIVERYFIPFMVLYIPLIVILFERSEKIYGYLKRTVLISGIVLFVFGQAYLNFQSMALQDGNSVRKGYMQYLLDNQLDFGFSTFWNANVTTELTNGKIGMVGLESPRGWNPDRKVFSFRSWGNKIQHSNPSFYHGESFLLLTRAEWGLAQKTGRSFARLVPNYEDNDFIIIRYPSAEVIHHDVLDN